MISLFLLEKGERENTGPWVRRGGEASGGAEGQGRVPSGLPADHRAHAGLDPMTRDHNTSQHQESDTNPTVPPRFIWEFHLLLSRRKRIRVRVPFLVPAAF